MLGVLIDASSHIVSMQIRVDANVVVHFIERICGALAMASRARSQYNIHNLTLPVSWIMLLVRPGVFPKGIEPESVDEFLSSVDVIVDALFSSTESFLQRRNMPLMDFTLKKSLLDRM